MRKEAEFWSFVSESLSANEAVILLVVVKSSGSSPGRPGFKMAVGKDSINGSIGGGVMEVGLVDRAQRLLESGTEVDMQPSRQVHRKNSEDASGMICSGEQTILFRRIEPIENAAVLKCIDALETEKAALLRVTPHELSVEYVFDQSGIEFGVTEEGYTYTQPLGFINELVVFGGGHCALALSEMMAKLDFRVCIYDDRPGLSTLAKNDFADQINLIDDYETAAREIESGSNRFVVVMTLGYAFDKVIIRELVRKDFRYFGVLGSKAKMAVLMKELEEEGFDKDRLGAIHTPIGLRINSRTPEEIAVSIAAEIIAVKNGG